MTIPLSDSAELLGITVEGPPPVGEVHLNLRQGVSALYGLNGAGKSALLKAIKAALSGRVAPGVKRAAMHIRMLDPNAPISLAQSSCSLSSRICGFMASSIKSRFQALQEASVGSYEQFDGSSYPSWMSREPTPVRLVRWLALTDGLSVEDIDEAGGVKQLEEFYDVEIDDEIATQGLFTLEAVGVDEALWKVFISAQLGETTPLLSHWYQKEATQIRWLRDRMGVLEGAEPTKGELEDLLEEMKSMMPSRTPTWADSINRPFHDASVQYQPLPHWVPFSVVEIGELSGKDRGLIPRIVDDDFHPDGVLVSSFLGFRNSNKAQALNLFETMGPFGIKVSSEVEEWLLLHSRSATAIFANLLLDAPALRCTVKDPNLVVTGPLLQWEAVDAPSGQSVPLADLSEAQARWARIAIRLAFIVNEASASTPAFIVLDEPEQALHPLAERYMTHGLRSAAAYIQGSAIVATHSKELLNSREVQVIRVFRDKTGTTAVSSLDPAERGRLGHLPLGISPADFFQSHRVILAVEGIHDQIVLQTKLRDELLDSAVHIVKLNGADSLDVVNANMVVDLTEAHLLIALDQVGLSNLPADWEKARTVDDVDAAIRRLEMYLGNRKSEVRTLASFCTECLRRGAANRLHVFGFTKPDIIQYLPVKDFVESAESWEQVVEEWHLTSRQTFKDWLRTAKQVSVLDRLERSAFNMKEEPQDFRRLAEKCKQLAHLTAPLE